MNCCNVCYIYPPHAPALCTEYKTWKDRHVLFPNEMYIEEHNRFLTVNDALKGFENLALDLSCLKVGYLIHHYSDFQSHDCIEPLFNSKLDCHNHYSGCGFEELRSQLLSSHIFICASEEEDFISLVKFSLFCVSFLIEPYAICFLFS